jgi:hypothetical protein
LLSSLALHWPALARWSSPTVLSALMELSDGPGTDVLVLRSENEGRFLKSDCLQERWPPARVVRHLFSSPAPSSGPAAGAENQATETVRLAADGIYARTPLTEQALADCDLKVLEAMMGQPAQVANCGVWIGSASNITPFHYDLCHGFLVQVLGTKTFTFVEVQKEKERCMHACHELTFFLNKLYFQARGYIQTNKETHAHVPLGSLALSRSRALSHTHMQSRTHNHTRTQPAEWKCMYPRDLSPELSHVDFESWRGRCGPEAASRERQRYPNFERAELRSVTLRPGDVIYTPPYWWHHVETSGEAAAVSVLVPFDQSKEEAATLGEGSSHYLIHYR